MTKRMSRKVEHEPEHTVTNIPDEVLKAAISIVVRYGACPECETEQFYTVMPGHNAYHYCVQCDEEVIV